MKVTKYNFPTFNVILMLFISSQPCREYFIVYMYHYVWQEFVYQGKQLSHCIVNDDLYKSDNYIISKIHINPS